MNSEPVFLDSEPVFVMPDRRKVICVVRMEHAVAPGFEVAGKTICFGCDQWCWLDPAGFKVVSKGEATPMCVECMTPIVNMPGVIDLGRG